MAASKPVTNYEFVVAVRLTGFGDVQDAATVFGSYTGQFLLANGDTAEITGVEPLPDDAEISIPAPSLDLEKTKAEMKKASSG